MSVAGAFARAAVAEPPPFVAAPTFLRSSGCRLAERKVPSRARSPPPSKAWRKSAALSSPPGTEIIAVALAPAKTAVVAAFDPGTVAAAKSAFETAPRTPVPLCRRRSRRRQFFFPPAPLCRSSLQRHRCRRRSRYSRVRPHPVAIELKYGACELIATGSRQMRMCRSRREQRCR